MITDESVRNSNSDYLSGEGLSRTSCSISASLTLTTPAVQDTSVSINRLPLQHASDRIRGARSAWIGMKVFYCDSGLRECGFFFTPYHTIALAYRGLVGPPICPAPESFNETGRAECLVTSWFPPKQILSSSSGGTNIG